MFRFSPMQWSKQTLINESIVPLCRNSIILSFFTIVTELFVFTSNRSKFYSCLDLSIIIVILYRTHTLQDIHVLLSASVSDNFGNSPQMAAPRRSCEIDQSTQRFHVGWFHVGCQRGLLGREFLGRTLIFTG